MLSDNCGLNYNKYFIEDNEKMNIQEKHCKIHFIKALSGDSFLIEPEDKKCILIDCGYKSTYEKELRPVLINLKKNGGRISLLVVTHMDADHIGGAIAFLQENGESAKPKIIDIDNIWFNCLFQVCYNEKLVLQHLRDSLDARTSKKNLYIRNQLEKLIAFGDGFISATHAEAFELICKKNHYSLNVGSENGLIQEGQEIPIGNCKVKVLSPGKQIIDNFAKWIDKNLIDCFGKEYRLEKSTFLDYLEKVVLVYGIDENGSEGCSEISSACPDIETWIGTSKQAPMNAANRMSIVLEIEYSEKTMLFLGDSESGDWVSKARRRYDLVKMSHHGTLRPNLELLKQIEFKKAIISTNGRKNHPEDDLLARVIQNEVEDIFFNYNIRRKEDILSLQKKYNFKAHFGESPIIL